MSLKAVNNTGDTLTISEESISSILRQTPMPELYSGRLAKILTRYYNEGLGGPENWEKISSFKVTGTLKLKDIDFELSAFQKKPNLLKMTIRGKQGFTTELGHDGEIAWQKLHGEAEAQPMPADVGRRFLHNARFGSHLLYPYAEGKTIEYIDTVPANGNVCHQIRVVLDTNYQVDYFIDIRSYLEMKVVNIDLLDGKKNSIIYKDYIRESGMPIARQVENYESGEWVSTLRIEHVKVNSGVVPWMFKIRE